MKTKIISLIGLVAAFAATQAATNQVTNTTFTVTTKTNVVDNVKAVTVYGAEADIIWTQIRKNMRDVTNSSGVKICTALTAGQMNNSSMAISVTSTNGTAAELRVGFNPR